MLLPIYLPLELSITAITGTEFLFEIYVIFKLLQIKVVYPKPLQGLILI